MAQVKKQQIRSERARGLDPEFTAQPRLVPDALALEASAEPELSVDADELGSRFLRDATEQGDFDPERAWPEESSLIEAPAGDQPLANEGSIWEQTVDLETRTQGAADMLRDPAPPAAAASDGPLRETLPDPIDVQDNSAHILDNSVREFSLFDARDESEAARVPRASERVRIEHEREPHERRTRGAAPPSQPGRVRLLRGLLSRSANALRSIASRLQHRRS